MANHRLVSHPQTPCPAVRRLTVRPARGGDGSLDLAYALDGELDRLRIPASGAQEDGEELWRHTCFEAFVMSEEGPDYLEFNFSPSGAGTAYAFRGYRRPARGQTLARPETRWRFESGGVVLEVHIPPLGLPHGRRLRLGICAVLEDASGNLSYWALRHPPGRPDFHHRDAFALELKC